MVQVQIGISSSLVQQTLISVISIYRLHELYGNEVESTVQQQLNGNRFGPVGSRIEPETNFPYPGSICNSPNDPFEDSFEEHWKKEAEDAIAKICEESIDVCGPKGDPYEELREKVHQEETYSALSTYVYEATLPGGDTFKWRTLEVEKGPTTTTQHPYVRTGRYEVTGRNPCLGKRKNNSEGDSGIPTKQRQGLGH